MKIAFWSNTGQKSGVSSNLAAISVASVIRFPYTISVFENHLCYNNLGRAFFNTPNVDMLHEVGTNYYEGGGMEGILRKIYRGDYQKDILKAYIKEIIYQHLYYIPQSRVIHNEMFDYEFNHSITPLFRLMEDYTDLCFIDTAGQNSLSSKTILEEADLIVVNLCQNSLVLDDFILNYSSLIPKALFIIGNYTFHSLLTVKRISKQYQIPMENMTVIPSNPMFRDAFHNGSIVEFITVNYTVNKENENYLFIQGVKMASHMIIKRIEHLRSLEERVLSNCGR